MSTTAPPQKGGSTAPDREPLTHEQRIAIIGRSPQSLEWFEKYHQYLGWMTGFVEGREDCRLNHAPPF